MSQLTWFLWPKERSQLCSLATKIRALFFSYILSKKVSSKLLSKIINMMKSAIFPQFCSIITPRISRSFQAKMDCREASRTHQSKWNWQIQITLSSIRFTNSKLYSSKISFGSLCYSRAHKFVFMKELIIVIISNLLKWSTTILTCKNLLNLKSNASTWNTTKCLSCSTI